MTSRERFLRGVLATAWPLRHTNRNLRMACREAARELRALGRVTC